MFASFDNRRPALPRVLRDMTWLLLIATLWMATLATGQATQPADPLDGASAPIEIDGRKYRLTFAADRPAEPTGGAPASKAGFKILATTGMAPFTVHAH